MNHRVQELVKQAWEERDLVTSTRALDDAFIDKLSELIVRDCIDIADDYDGVGITIVERIKKQFGVE